jgi:hypothetical protein
MSTLLRHWVSILFRLHIIVQSGRQHWKLRWSDWKWRGSVLHLGLRLTLCLNLRVSWIANLTAQVLSLFLAALLLTWGAQVAENAIHSAFAAILEDESAWLTLTKIVSFRTFRRLAWSKP